QDPGAGHATGSPRGVAPDLLRVLAANARLLLLADDERHRLEGHARQIRGVIAVRESSQRSHILVRRTHRRIEYRPSLCWRGRTPCPCTDQVGPAWRGTFPRPGYARLSNRPHFARRKLGQENTLTAYGYRGERKARRLHFGNQQHAGLEFAKPL